jgi:hypothetical protein
MSQRSSKLVKRFRCRYPPEEKKMAAVIEAVKKRRLVEIASHVDVESNQRTDLMSENDFENKMKQLEKQKLELEQRKSNLFQQLRSALTTSQTTPQQQQEGEHKEKPRR